jgi:hypothetical protein
LQNGNTPIPNYPVAKIPRISWLIYGKKFDELRKQVYPEFGKHEQSGAPIPF